MQQPVGTSIDAEIKRVKMEIEQRRLHLNQVNADMSNIRARYQQKRIHGGGFLHDMQRYSKDAKLKKQQPVKEQLQREKLVLEQKLNDLKLLKAQGITTSQYPPYDNQSTSNISQYSYNQYQPGYPPTTVPSPTLKQRKSPKQVWKNAGKGGRCSIIAVCLLLSLSLCICISVATTSTSNVNTTLVPTHTTTKTQVKATAKPTIVPTPRPTKAPIATPIPPTPVPTQPPSPTQVPVQTGVNGNPWGYDFTDGNYIYNPDPAFCTYFTCVSTFWTKTSGYVAECSNGSYTHSGGISGACSRDGGVEQVLYSH